MPDYEPREEPAPTEPIASERIKTDRKTFFVDLFENHHGAFVKITERRDDAHGNEKKRDRICVPIECATDLARHLNDFASR